MGIVSNDNGCPSDDTLRRFFRSLDSKSFEAAFIRWVRSFQLDLEYKVVVLDGKPQEEALIKMESLCIWLALLPVNLA